ncbi:MAG: hypothetical protein ACI9MC_003120 [Kiritimatiellia bacterium]|jgi:hypothetical protein
MTTHPPALPHGLPTEIFDGIYMVTGAMKMNVLMSFDRNMTIVRHPGGLALFNTVRMNEAGLAALDALGEVTDVVRLGAFHGRDDAFYVERYGARMWAPEGCSERLSPTALNEDSDLPIEGAQVFVFHSATKPEAIVRLPDHGGVLIPCDSLQNWLGPHAEYTSLPARLMMRLMGFFKPAAVGLAWLKAAKPAASCFHRLQEWDYEVVLPSHGEPMLNGAKAAYTPAIEAAIAKG